MPANAHSSPKTTTLAWIAPIACAIFQILTPTLPLLGFGRPIGDQSDSVRTLITPAGWAFAIWGVLYTGTIVFAIYQALPKHRDDALLARIRWPAAGAFLGNGLWALYTQTFSLTAISVIIILGTLACLLVIYRIVATWPAPFTAGERWCVVLPLTALASWLTVASMVNIAAALRFHGVEGGDATPMIAAAVLIAAGIIAATAILSGRGNLPYALVMLWALSAIYAAGGRQSQPVAIAVIAAAILVILSLVIGLRRGGYRHWFANR
jgi:hypothetical protein